MLGSKTKAILGLIATALIGMFSFGLAESISSGFAGFYGGLPFWIIVIFVMGLATYDYLDECVGISDRIKFFLHVGCVMFCGSALAYGAWGTSTLFAEKGDILVRSSWFDNYTVNSLWFEIFWMVMALVLAAVTAIIAMRMIEKRKHLAEN